MGIDVEREAALILTRLGFGTTDRPGIRKIIDRTPGVCLKRVHLVGAEGECCRLRDGYVLGVSWSVRPQRVPFVAAHEYAHVHLDQLGHGGPELEAACDGIASALCCPRDAFERAALERGRAWKQLGLDFAVEPTCAALRYHEVLGVPGALVSPATVRVRGPQHDWQGEPRELARAKRLPRGVKRERVPDALLRVLLSAS